MIETPIQQPPAMYFLDVDVGWFLSVGVRRKIGASGESKGAHSCPYLTFKHLALIPEFVGGAH